MRLLTPSPTDRESSAWRDLDVPAHLRWPREEWAELDAGEVPTGYLTWGQPWATR